VNVKQLQMTGIRKSFSGVTVLNGVDLSVQGGRVTALLGENGAGKSTLMKILTGVYLADAGEIRVDGQPVVIRNVDAARALGIGMIHQELNLFTNLSIAENFLIGNESRYRLGGFVQYARLNRTLRETLESLQLNRSPSDIVGTLGVGEQQLVEIGKALQQDIRFLAMDEPTAALTQTETKRLFEIIQGLSAQNVGIIYISHRLEELFQIADDVTVLRDGKFVASRTMAETTEDELVSLMVGRDITERYPTVKTEPGHTILAANHLTNHRVKDAKLEVRAGEIVGLGGLMGAGRTELARAIAGVDKLKAGELVFLGKHIRFRSPAEAIRSGIAFVTEDRKEQGLVLPFSIRHNVSLPTLRARSKGGIVNRNAETNFVREVATKLRVKMNTIDDQVGGLSGGNQQKVVIAKWLANNPMLFILDEPTRGVDVGAKQEIYHLMNQLKQDGKAILMISSDLPELLGMSDRVYVMHEGKVQGELHGEHLTEENFMRLATGGENAWKNSAQ
jgi:ribose transport system ATP-binding protein